MKKYITIFLESLLIFGISVVTAIVVIVMGISASIEHFIRGGKL